MKIVALYFAVLLSFSKVCAQVKTKLIEKKIEFWDKQKLLNKHLHMLEEPSDPISVAETQDMILRYATDPIAGLDSGKGFYLDNKLIDSIRKYDGSNGKPKIESVYLYLSKKPLNPAIPKHDGRYTLIAVPAKIVQYPPSNRDTNFLMTGQMLEWHDPISLHPPINEQSIIK